MSQQRFDLTVEPREPGKRTSRELRRTRRIPAVVYGGTAKPSSISLDEGVVRKYNVRAFENALFTLKGEGAINNIVALIKEVKVDPVTRNPQHVDLFALDLKKAVRISIEIRVEGKPIGIADGGLLNIVNRQIEIECLPTEIPDGITVDVSGMGVGDSIHVSDLNLPSGVKLISSPDMTVAVVNLQEEEVVAAPTAEAAAAPAAGAAAGAAAAAPAKGAAAPAKGAAAPAKDAKK